MIQVSVPATSANVGPGFDCMGLALNLYAHFRFTPLDYGFSISGCREQWRNAQNLVYQGYAKVFAALHQEVSGVAIDIDAAAIPTARGLGSSAACIVAGALAANAFCGMPFSRKELVDLCTELEGHPDNVAPALLGGLSISFCEDRQVITSRYDIHPSYYFAALIPDVQVATEDARKVLPQALAYGDAIHNIGRCAAVARALETGDGALLAHACVDRLHEPYRKHLIPDYEHVKAKCVRLGMLCLYISGSGSTLMAITQEKTRAISLCAQISEMYPAWRCEVLQGDDKGTIVEEVYK